MVRGLGLRVRLPLSRTAIADLETLAFSANSSCVRNALLLSSRRVATDVSSKRT